MTTISAGTSLTLTAVVDGQTYTVTVNGGSRATVSGATVATIGPLPERRSLGPYSIGAVLVVSADTGSVGIDYGDDTPGSFGPQNGGSVSAVSISSALDAATPEELAAIQSSVSGDRAKLNATQQAQQAAGATTALLNAAKTGVKDPSGGSDILFAGAASRYKTTGPLASVLSVTGLNGDEALVTDVGLGVVVRWGSSGWKMAASQVLALDSTLATASATTAEVVVKRVALPAGVLSIINSLTISAGWQKTGVNAAATACRCRVGIAGTVSDGIVMTTAQMTATYRSVSFEKEYLAPSQSVLRLMGLQATDSADYGAGRTSVAYPVEVAVGDTSANTMYVSLTMQMAATTDQPGAYLLRVTGR